MADRFPAERVRETLQRHLLLDGFPIVLDLEASQGATLIDAVSDGPATVPSTGARVPLYGNDTLGGSTVEGLRELPYALAVALGSDAGLSAHTVETCWRILVLVDADEDTQARVGATLAGLGVPRLDYAAPTAMT